MAKRAGEISTGQAARLLEVHVHTVRRWCGAAVHGGRSPLRNIRVDAVGRYWLDRAEVLQFRDDRASTTASAPTTATTATTASAAAMHPAPGAG